jgi:hypothetical protein
LRGGDRHRGREPAAVAPVPVPDFLCVGIRGSTSAKAVSAKKPPFA